MAHPISRVLSSARGRARLTDQRGLASPLSPVPRRAVLDPFEVDARGERLLAARLRALDLDRIRDIALEYELVPPKIAAFATRAELIVEILATVATARRELAER